MNQSPTPRIARVIGASGEITEPVFGRGEPAAMPARVDGEHPAVFTMHCPSGATNACVKHARSIEGLYQLMWGMLVQATKAPEGSQCDNCVNEVATGERA